MIRRDLAPVLRRAAAQYPVVTLTGPRQSGKTTLCRATFPRKPYVSLEPMDRREYARQDPRGFLAEYPSGAIFDEIQNVPDLTGFLQEEVDARPRVGRFILTGSRQLGLLHTVSQSLAGRTAVLHLLAPGLGEVRRFPEPPDDLMSVLWTGAYPRIHDQRVPAGRWLADYVSTYLQRDVRQVLNVVDLSAFTTFLRLAAGRTGQELNLSTLGADAGISHNTARSWLSVLEASFICFRVPAWHANLRKQAIKAPKLHFYDSGLVCHLLGIRGADELLHHPQRGAIFESWVASEVVKTHLHRGEEPRLHHFRDAKGLEVDMVLDGASKIHLIESKSGRTITDDFFSGLRRLVESTAQRGQAASVEPILVYGGDETQRRRDARVVPWSRLDKEKWK
jgi:predicted AAA+ superfamily ATPase